MPCVVRFRRHCAGGLGFSRGRGYYHHRRFAAGLVEGMDSLDGGRLRNKATQGELHGRVGMFPLNFVEPMAPPRPNQGPVSIVQLSSPLTRSFFRAKARCWVPSRGLACQKKTGNSLFIAFVPRVK